MNLIIDVGNSFVKLAVFKKDEIVKKKTIKHKYLLKHIGLLKNEFNLKKDAIISSVGKLNSEELDYLQEHFRLLILDSSTKVPFKNKYKTPKTLGIDRIALVSASAFKYPNNNVLIIDAGSCITYDFINTKNEYFGGAISPGIRMRYEALHNFTANLPLLDTEIPKKIIGNSTNTSMHSGVVFGVLKEMDGVINDYNKKYSDLTVILTGGDAKFLSKQLKSSIFANSNFLLEGLNYILQFNTN